MTERYGVWPGVVAIVGDADMYCVPCAKLRYGDEAIETVVGSVPGYEHYTDHENNPLGVVLYGSEDVHGMYCGKCHQQLCDEECTCYKPGQAAHWQQDGSFFEEGDEEDGEEEDEDLRESCQRRARLATETSRG